MSSSRCARLCKWQCVSPLACSFPYAVEESCSCGITVSCARSNQVESEIWMAPEMFSPSARPSFEADVFSLSVVMYEVR